MNWNRDLFSYRFCCSIRSGIWDACFLLPELPKWSSPPNSRIRPPLETLWLRFWHWLRFLRWHKRWKSSRLLVRIFDVEGTVDLFTAITLATIYNPAPYMGAAYWIPAFWVPARR